MAEPAPAPSPPAPSPRQKLLGFQQFDVRIKELTGSQEELLGRIQKLKQEVQQWRSNLNSQVKACRDELIELKKGLNSEVEQLKLEFKEMRSAIEMEKSSLAPQIINSEINDFTKQARKSQDQVMKDGSHMEEETAVQV